MVFCLPLWPFFFVLLWRKPLRFISSLDLALGVPPPPRLERAVFWEACTAQSLWWALNSSWAVSADSRSQKGKTNKLSRVWVCWEALGGTRENGGARPTGREGLWDQSHAFTVGYCHSFFHGADQSWFGDVTLSAWNEIEFSTFMIPLKSAYSLILISDAGKKKGVCVDAFHHSWWET